jgi:hypothetical protein
MVEVKVVKKYNPRTRALEPEELPTDVKPLFAARQTATAAGDLNLGSYSVPTGKVGIITGVKYASSSQDTWFSFGGDLTDYAYIAGAGEGMLAGSPDNPVWTLDEGQSVVATVLGAQSGVTYAVVIYGRLRDKVFKGLTPQG